MKRIVFIACLLLSCLAMHGVVTTSHVFNSTDPANKIVSFADNYKQATMTDGTLYTCSGAEFANVSGICIDIPRNGVVVVSPARQGLRSFTVTHNSLSGGANMSVEISTDNVTYTAIPEGQLNRQSTFVEASGLSGDYYIRLTNTYTPNTHIYVTIMNYQTEPEPESCRCLRVVVN